jgi:hypothetical protein
VETLIEFTAETYQNEFLPPGGTEVSAIVSIDAHGSEMTPVAGSRTEILILDRSASMAGHKLAAMKRAAKAAIDCIRDGVWFGVIAGNETGHQIFPPPGWTLAVSNEATRADACQAIDELTAGGGTAMGRWLLLAREMFGSRPDAHGHAILLTDGNNQSEYPEALQQAIAECTDTFQCDCRGIGTDWVVDELRSIATALLGTVDIVAHPRDLATDFRSLMETAMAKGLGDVWLDLWTPLGATVKFMKQVAPAVVDLTDRQSPTGPRVVRFPGGGWGDESREYHVAITVPAQSVGEEMLAGRLSVVVGEDVRTQAQIRAVWTNDHAEATRVNRLVAHYTGQAALAQAIHEGLEARRRGDATTATAKLGLAVQLAAESGNDETMRLLAGVVDIEDAESGTVRLKRSVSALDEMTLDARSTKTVRVPGAPT